MLRLLTMIALISICYAFELPPCHDYEKMAEVQQLVDRYQFCYQWENDTFDCVDMAAANWRFMKAAGYDPIIVICHYPGGGGHCYVAFPLGEGWAGLDTRQSLNGDRPIENLGTVVPQVEGYDILRNDTALYAYDPRGPPSIAGQVIGPKTPALPPIFSQ